MQTEIFCGNGLRTTYAYDNRNQLTSLTAGLDGKEPLLQAAYEYDVNGNRTGKEEWFQRKAGGKRTAEKTAYSYDKMNRLTGETRNGRGTVYRYDLAGNRISRSREGNEETYRYNRRNQLTELIDGIGNVRYSYDPAGNLLEENHVSTVEGDRRIQYAYDSYNRNTGIKGNDFLQKNTYDAEGYRCSLKENGETTYFTYRSGMLLSEQDGEDIKSYVLGNEYVGLAGGTGREYEARYYVTDEQGSIRYVLNGNGEVESCYQYAAFGESIVQEGNRSRLQYNSQIWDELSGLYYLRTRYYNPVTGRFTQEDVIYDDGLNLYAYCNGNPVIYCDPSGLRKSNPISSDNSQIMDIMKSTTKDNIIPSGKKFISWFDGLSYNDIEVLYSDKKVKMAIMRKLRNGSGKHEWLAVSRAPQWKKWGISVKEVFKGTNLTKEVKFINILKSNGIIASGFHGCYSEGVIDAAHKELFKIIESSNNFEEFKEKLNIWADEHLEIVNKRGKIRGKGASALPENLQTEATKNKCKKKG